MAGWGNTIGKVTLHIAFDCRGGREWQVIHLDKDGPADQDFLKKAKDAAKHWQSTHAISERETRQC